MKSISYNPTVAMSILLGAVASSLNPQAVVLVSSKDGSNFKKILEDAGVKPELKYAVVLLDEYNEKGQMLELGIEALYHDWPTNYEKKSRLIDVFGNSKITIDEIVAQGKTISEYLKSPSVTGEIQDNSTEEEEPEFKSTEELLHPVHLEPESKEEPVDFDEFVNTDQLIKLEDNQEKKAEIAAALEQGSNIDGMSEAGKTGEDSDVVIVNKNDADIDDVAIPEEKPVAEYSGVASETNSENGAEFNSSGIDPYATEEEQNTSSVETPVEEKPAKKPKK